MAEWGVSPLWGKKPGGQELSTGDVLPSSTAAPPQTGETYGCG